MKNILKTLRQFASVRFIFVGIACLCGVKTAVAQQGHTLTAYYNFDSGDPYSDSSGNNDELNGSGWGGNGYILTTNAVAGGQAIYFDGYESLAAYWPGHTADNWTATFYGSYSMSFWMNTTNVSGLETDDLGYQDPAIIYDFNFNGGGADSTIIGLTGTKVGFTTVDPNNNYDTLHSVNDVTVGSYVHVVVTRDQVSGEKKIYVNGVLDSSEIGITNNLDGDNNYASIGGNGYNGTSYTGLLDDVQMYTGVLSASDVAYLYANPGMSVPNVAGPAIGLAAFYDFDEGYAQAADLTANGNNLVNGGNFVGPTISSDSVSGGGAVYFNGNGFLTPSSNLLSTLAGNFSLSLWVKTTQNAGYGGEPPYQGEGIFAADNPGDTNDITPLGLTGGGLGFNSGSSTNSDDWINSTININDGNYHHVVVTRNYVTGEKQMFIDGVFNISDTNNPGLENAPMLATIGAMADASNPDPSSPSWTGGNGFVGLVDDIQLYSRVITPGETLYLHNNPGANVTNGLVCHYDFDEGTVLASDVSGNGNDMEYAGHFGSGPGVTGNSESGAGAVNFNGGSYLVPEGNLPSTLAGDFSLSVWLETTQSMGNAGDQADNGAGVITADVPGQANDLVPIALTGGNVAFETGGSYDALLTSTVPINDGNYHHVVVTRAQSTGQKQIYIDGALNATGTDDASILNRPQILILGALADASQGDPSSPSSDAVNGYAGLMDQLQIYSRVISSNDVAFLYANPGATLTTTNVVVSGPTLGMALGQPGWTWNTSGDAQWFSESTNTYGTNTEAVQSGRLLDGQSSVLQTTVTGPATLTFYWQSLANNGDDFDLEFDIDGGYADDISGRTGWAQDTFSVGSGTHTLTWNANTLGGSGSSPTDAGFVDEVVLQAGIPPTITLNPASQTIGFREGAMLVAAATGIPAPTWQWYQVGNSNPIAGATNAYYYVYDYSSSNTTESFYAVASNVDGSQPTTTATLTLLTTLLTPDWTGAWPSPFTDYGEGNYDLTANDGYYSCAVDGTGTNVYSSGYANGSNYLNTGAPLIASAPGQNAAIIVKQTTTGVSKWVVAVTNNGNGDAYAEGLALAADGGVYATGYFSGTNWLGNTSLKDAGEGTLFLTRLDPNGNVLWITTVSNSFAILNGVVADASGNVTVTGVFSGSTSVGGSNVTVSGQSSFVAQFNSSGQLNWVDNSSSIIEYLQDGGGRIYASLLNWFGNTNDSLGGITNATDRAWGLASLNATNGRGIWIRGVGEAFAQHALYVIDDVPLIATAGSNVFLVGTAYGSSAVFGPYTVPISNGRGQYFARYDTNGNAQLATSGFGSATTQPQAAVANAAGDVYMAGSFDGDSTFGDDTISAPRFATLGNGDFGQAFAAKFNSAGVPQWARMALAYGGGDPGNIVNLYDVALGGSNIWVAGFGSGPISWGEDDTDSNLYETGSYPFTTVYFDNGMLAFITDVEPPTPPSPVSLINTQLSGGDLQFSFMSQANHTNYVQYSTNLASGIWLPYSTIVGDGTLKTISVPANSPKAEFFRIKTQ